MGKLSLRKPTRNAAHSTNFAGTLEPRNPTWPLSPPVTLTGQIGSWAFSARRRKRCRWLGLTMNWRLCCRNFPNRDRFSRNLAPFGRPIGRQNSNAAVAERESQASHFIHIVMPGPRGRVSEYLLSEKYTQERGWGFDLSDVRK